MNYLTTINEINKAEANNKTFLHYGKWSAIESSLFDDYPYLVVSDYNPELEDFTNFTPCRFKDWAEQAFYDHVKKDTFNYTFQRNVGKLKTNELVFLSRLNSFLRASSLYFILDLGLCYGLVEEPAIIEDIDIIIERADYIIFRILEMVAVGFDCTTPLNRKNYNKLFDYYKNNVPDDKLLEIVDGLRYNLEIYLNNC